MNRKTDRSTQPPEDRRDFLERFWARKLFRLKGTAEARFLEEIRQRSAAKPMPEQPSPVRDLQFAAIGKRPAFQRDEPF